MRRFNPVNPFYAFFRYRDERRHSLLFTAKYLRTSIKYAKRMAAEVYIIDIRNGSVVYTQEASE